MTGAGIYDGDLLVVDRSIEPVHVLVLIVAHPNATRWFAGRGAFESS
jgi:SOS-response transcriptional repressor LexA